MEHGSPERAPQDRPEQPQAQPAPGAPPRVEVEAEPTSGAASAGRVYDAPPPPREPPPNPFSASGEPHGTPAAPSRGWAVGAHLIGLLDFGVSFFGAGLIATAALWLVKRGDDPQVDFHGKESLNFQLNLLFWQIAAFPLILLCGLGVLILFLSPLVKIAMLIYAAVRASEGERFRYPYILRVIP